MYEQTLYCERCRRPLGPELLACPERESGTCPYQVIHSKVVKSGIIGWIFLLAGIGVAGVGIVLPLINADASFIPGMLCMLPFGLLFAAAGLYLAAATRTTLHNQQTGQMWEQMSIFGFPVSQKIASALEMVTFRVTNMHSQQYPPSVSALYPLGQQDPRSTKKWTMLATDILYTTLLGLVGQGHLELQHTQVIRKSKSERFFALRPGATATGGGSLSIRGDLESRIVQAVAEWSQREDSSIKVRNSTYARKLRHCFIVHDLVYIIMEGKWNNPGSHLVTHIVGPDAAQQGIGQVEGGLIVRRFAIPSEAALRLQTDYDSARDIAQQFASAHPDLASELHTQIQKAIESCVDTD